MDDKKLAALARKNAAKAIKKDLKPQPKYDSTLDATKPDEPEDPIETDRFFKEMKRREF